jgi:alkanesulfonate monooxygenase SsuD/methylene tetrahydromethanopterin reductase-like flavin-dependent oxidoreductase (luciferase family)
VATRLQLGLDTFGDVTRDAEGRLLPQAQVIRNVVAEAVLADELGLDFFGVGEHHRDDFAVSAPDVVLAAIAGQTRRIRLGSAVTVLSSDDPVRVFQRFSTLDAVSGGRAELFAELLKQQPVTWSGHTRAALTDQMVYPPTESGSLMTWVAVGGSPESVVRAARHGLPLTLAIIGGAPAQFRPLVDLYHRALRHFEKLEQPVAVHSPGYVAVTDQQALDEAWPHYVAMHARIGRERGWRPITREQYEHSAGPNGALLIGSPQTVAAKIAKVVRELGLTRFDLKYSLGTLPHAQLMNSIRLYATEVAPLVRAQLGAPEHVAAGHR